MEMILKLNLGVLADLQVFYDMSITANLNVLTTSSFHEDPNSRTCSYKQQPNEKTTWMNLNENLEQALSSFSY